MKINDIEKQFKETEISFPEDKHFFVFVGQNNSGKTTILRSIFKKNPKNSYIVLVNRTELIGEGALSKDYDKSRPAFKSELQNISDDNNNKKFQTLQDFFKLNDKAREEIINWYNSYFPNTIHEEREDEENTASPMLLKVNNHSITKQGSGIRSTLDIFISLFDPEIKFLCIDEPELGLEPSLQKVLFQAIKDKASSDKKIFISTHSHHFLDYENMDNNYICQRNSGGKITIETVSDLQPIIFRLLGNTLSSLLMPEYIIIVEGPSDRTIIDKSLKLLGKNGYVIHSANSNSNITSSAKTIETFLKFNKETKSIYQDRIYVIADLATEKKKEWENLLKNPKKQLIILPKNGIEYFYPEKILQAIFSTNDTQDQILDQYLKSKQLEYNGKKISKPELATQVAERIKSEDLNNTENELFKFLESLEFNSN